MTPPRAKGGQPSNSNALKHALYARHYPPATKKSLLKWDMKNYIGEVHLLRASMDKMAEILLVQVDLQASEKVAMVNAIANAAKTVTTLVNKHLLLNTGDDPIYKAWDDITNEQYFFNDGVPPE